MLKFPTRQGTGVVLGSHQVAKQCHMAALREARVQTSLQIKLDSREEVERPIAVGELEEVLLVPTRKIKIGADMSPTRKESLIALLCEFSDLFAWAPVDMPGIDPVFISHRLTISPCARPIIQKR